MLIDVVRPETWEELNDEVRNVLGLSPKLKARVFQGLGQAVFEIAQGSAQFMAHKKSIGVIRGQTPVFESLLPYYYKETYEVHSLSHLALVNVKEFVEGLKKDTNFVLFAEDNPVTGEVFPFVDELDKLLNEKRIYSFRVSHALHFSQAEELRPYTVRLCSFAADLAVAVLGERFRSPSLSAFNQNWNKNDILLRLQQARQVRPQDAKAVQDFEAQVQDKIPLYFSANSKHLNDRAVLVIPDASAEAVAQLLFKKLGWSAAEGFQKIESTNQCHWSTGAKTFKTWWEPAPSAQQVRGLLIISLAALQTKDFANLLISSYEEIKQLQSWTP
jgi:hypothetical protein